MRARTRNRSRNALFRAWSLRSRSCFSRQAVIDILNDIVMNDETRVCVCVCVCVCEIF